MAPEPIDRLAMDFLPETVIGIGNWHGQSWAGYDEPGLERRGGFATG